jgi:hypothetical protein
LRIHEPQSFNRGLAAHDSMSTAVVVPRLVPLKVFGSLFGVEPTIKYFDVVARGMCRPTDTAAK